MLKRIRQAPWRSAVTGVALVALVAACSGSTATTAPTAGPTTPPGSDALPSQASGGAPEAELEIISPWTSGGENAALNALVAVYNQKYPSVKFVNAAVGGGGNTAADPLKLTRLQAGNPPDIWQAHGGADLFSNYVKPGYAADLTSLWKEEGWIQLAPKALLDVLAKDGKIYAVPFGIHRVNLLWYNKKLLDGNGVTLTDQSTLDDFIAAADKLKAAGVVPLCLGDKDPWTSNTIFEDALVGTLTAEQYNGLWTGATKLDDPAVVKAVGTYGQLLGYVNPDHSALTWDQATQKVIEGSCAATLMGDWAYGEFLKAGLKDNVDFGWIASPGSGAVFSVNNDLALTSDKAPDPVNSRNFLRVVGSQDGQIAFNRLKGSIPWRTDIDPSVFPVYLQYSMKAYSSLALVPSEAQGLAAPPAFQQAVNDAVTQFGVDKNVDAFVAALVAAAPQLNQ